MMGGFKQKSINEDKDNESKMFLGQLYFLTGKQTEGINNTSLPNVFDVANPKKPPTQNHKILPR